MKFIQRAVLLAATGLLAAGGAAAAAPGAAQAATITGAGTQWTFTGTGGDYVTQDQSYEYDPSNAVINASASTDDNYVSVDINQGGGIFWHIDFAAPQGQALTAGTTYNNVARYPFQSPIQPGLSFYGDGRGCNTVTGSFTVISASFGPYGWIKNFDATFTQHCEGDPNSAATGEVVLTNNIPPPPPLTVTISPAATDQVTHAGGQVTLTGTVTCNEAAAISMNGTLNQRLTRTTLATGNWYISSVVCGPDPTQWSTTVSPSGNIPFGTGKAELDGTYSTYDPIYQINLSGSFSPQVMLKS